MTLPEFQAVGIFAIALAVRLAAGAQLDDLALSRYAPSRCAGVFELGAADRRARI